MSTLTIKSIGKFLMLAVVTTFFFSCQKELSLDDSAPAQTPPDLVTKVSSSVSGFVTDENDAPVMGATVQFGSNSSTTDKYGHFEASNVQVVQEAAVVTITRAGYFKGIKTYIAKAGKAAFFRIKLIPKTIAGTVNSTTGGTVSLASGLTVKLNAGTIVNAATNAAYIGTVNMAAFFINPEAADLDRIMPGDLRGINTDGGLKTLQTFGMAAVELTGSSGELLQIVNGQKATLTMPIAPSLSSGAPATIPLWYFDEANGLWKEQGTAVKTGNTYVAEVSHFSFWNCDVPANYVQFDVTLKNSTGAPLAYTYVKITVAGTNNWRSGYTDSTGYVGGAVPGNASLLMEVFSNNCSSPIYAQPFTTTNVNISLGVITISSTTYFATLSGTVTDCSSAPVTNGYIVLHEGSYYTFYPLNNQGAFSFTKGFCTFPQTVTLIAEDITNAQQSASVSYVVTAGTNTVGNIQACGTSTLQFINYTINTTPYSFTSPADTFSYTNNNQSAIYLTGYRQTPNAWVNVNMSNGGIGVGSSQNLLYFDPSQVNDTLNIGTPILVNITEYGAIGQFVAGNFTGTMTGAPPGNITYNVTCNFRLRRAN
ncbi:MAG: hypothetical protein WAU23_14455 [Ferruginibacter sp.]